MFMHVYVRDELLGHAPLTFYWMLMAFIYVAAGGEAGADVWAEMAPVPHLLECVRLLPRKGR